MAFYFLALDLAYRRGTLSPERMEAIIEGLRQLPAPPQIEQVLESQERYIEGAGPRLQRNPGLHLPGPGD